MDDVFSVDAPPAAEEADFGMPESDGQAEFGSEPTTFDAPSDLGMGDFGAAEEPPAEAEGEPPADFGEADAAPVDMGAFSVPADMPSFEAPPTFEAPPASGAEFMAPTELSPVAKWRIEQQEKLASKKEKSDAALKQRLEEAAEALSKFYKTRTETTTKRAAENRAAEASYVQERDAAMIADSWESVCKLVDLKGTEKPTGDKDVSRMRGLLVQLKHT
mmetsp:Transcript_20858/g.47783  ORF Transcript_20858/g.47783 Transcript_20858/m.47783 type:complete len:218 (+) Transcript_20858:37-690(+)